MGSELCIRDSNRYVPRKGFVEEQSLHNLIQSIRRELDRHRNIPEKLKHISYNNLSELIEMMIYLMEGIQSQRIYGGKRKTAKKKTTKKKTAKKKTAKKKVKSVFNVLRFITRSKGHRVN
mgnify:CR=1 FL=1